VGAAQAEWTFNPVSEISSYPLMNASSVAWGDVDNDGDPDLFVGGRGESSSRLYRNVDGRLVDATAEFGLTTVNTHDVRKAQFVDFNGDGLLDIFYLTENTHGLRLLEQLTNHRFRSRRAVSEMEFFDLIRSAAWMDVDGDGSQELILSNGETSSSPAIVLSASELEYVENRGEPMGIELGSVGAICTEDFDGDGDLDIFLGSTDGSTLPQFLRNEELGYDDWADRFGMIPKMGTTDAVWLDYNNDQQWDLFLPGTSEYMALFRGAQCYNSHGLVMEPAIAENGLTMFGADAVSAQAVDANMDGWTDLYLTKPDGCVLLMNLEGQRWADVTASANLVYLSAFLSSAWADYDLDGDLDLAVATGEEGFRIYRNCVVNPHEFVNLRLVSGNGTSPALNCRVWMQFEMAKKIGTTTIGTGSINSDPSHVMLVNSSNYKSDQVNLIVNWPSGAESRYSLSDLTLNTTNVLREPVITGEMPEPVTGADRIPMECVVSPNPFNPSTMVSFNVPEAGMVDLKVFNLMGQEVASLARGSYQAGSHRVTFDGHALPSGLYLARLTVNGESRISRMLLAK